MRLSPAPRAIQCVLVSRWPRCTWARPAGRRAKDVYISYPQSCGGSEQRTVSGQTIESCTHVGERAVKRVASAGPSRGCFGDKQQQKGGQGDGSIFQYDGMASACWPLSR
jgi:hypothetical protein